MGLREVREVKGIKYGTCVLRVGVMTRPNLKWIAAIYLESNLQLNSCASLTDTVYDNLKTRDIFATAYMGSGSTLAMLQV